VHPIAQHSMEMGGMVTLQRNRALHRRGKSSGLDKIPVNETFPPLWRLRIAQAINISPSDKGGLAKNKPSQKRDAVQKHRLGSRRKRTECRNSRGLETRYPVFLLLGGIGLFVMGLVVHEENTDKRGPPMFYELDGTERQKYGIIQQT